EPEPRLHVVGHDDGGAHRDVEIGGGALALREARADRFAIDLRSALRRVEDRQPPAGDLHRLRPALPPDGRHVARNLAAVEDALQRLSEPARARAAIRDLIVLALVLDRPLTRPDLAQDVDVLTRAGERLPVRDAVPPLDDLRARRPEPADEAS